MRAGLHTRLYRRWLGWTRRRDMAAAGIGAARARRAALASANGGKLRNWRRITAKSCRMAADARIDDIFQAYFDTRPVQLDFTICRIEPISEGHSLISLCRGPIQIFVRWGPTQIVENRRKSRRLWRPWYSLAARAADTYRQKSLNCRKKRCLRRISEGQPDLRGSLIFPPPVIPPWRRGSSG